jgi:hypothetical protein
MFRILGLVRTTEVFDHLKLFQRLASELIPPNIKIHSCNEPDKAPRDFAACTASAHRISNRKPEIFDKKYEIPGLDR